MIAIHRQIFTTQLFTKAFKKLKYTSVIALLLAMIAACSIAKTQSTQAKLYGIQLERGLVQIWVKSNGCTTEADFDAQLLHKQGHDYLEISRTKIDPCRRKTTIIPIELQIPDLSGTKSIQIMNRFYTK